LSTEPDSQTRHDLAELFSATSAEVYGFISVRADSHDLADEILAQTYEAAARELARNPGTTVGIGWLVTVARRRLIDHWRRQRRRRAAINQLRHEFVAEQLNPGLELSTAPAPDRSQIVAALDALGDRQRAALTLRYLDEMSVPEVADALELSYSATESLLARARRSFRRAYEELGGPHEPPTR
jgi:RNA polymerase sigma-70 factor (ECF subfamily)